MAKAKTSGASRWMVVEASKSVEASLSRTWKALTREMDRWWEPGFFALETSKAMRLEPKLGGRMFESGGDASLVWFTVIGIVPERSIDLAGHLSPAWGGPAYAMLRFELDGDGKTTSVKVTESRVGAVDAGAATPTRKAWELLLGRLADHASARKRR
mgnify:FL=1